MTITSTISPLLYQEIIHIHHPRMLLLHHPPPPPTPQSNPVDPTEPYHGGKTGFEANVLMVLSVLLCALICSLGFNSIIKCALRCSTFSSPNSSDPNPTRLPELGIKKKALKSFATLGYDPDRKIPGLGTECVICLQEFCLDDKVRILPKCNHGFHAKCIDKWLRSHMSCPTCRHCLIDTCEKIIGGGFDCDNDGLDNSSQQQEQQQRTQNILPIVTQESRNIDIIAPLEREDLVRCYRNS